jgi:hypothetical protein
MRFTGFFGLLTLGVIGIMAASLEAKPAAATAAANGIVDIEKPGINALLGSTTK